VGGILAFPSNFLISGNRLRRVFWIGGGLGAVALSVGLFLWLNKSFVLPDRPLDPPPERGGPSSFRDVVELSPTVVPPSFHSENPLLLFKTDHPEVDLVGVSDRLGFVRVTLAEGHGWTRRRAWISEDQGVWTWTGRLPRSGRLVFQTGILSKGAGVSFSVGLEDHHSGEIHPLHAHRAYSLRHRVSRWVVFLPKILRTRLDRAAHQDERWRNVDLDLSRWGSKLVTLRFKSQVNGRSNEDRALALWGVPVVVFPQTEASLSAGVVVAVMERCRVDSSEKDFPEWETLKNNGLFFKRFYTTSVPASRAFGEFLLGAGPPSPQKPALTWVSSLSAEGWPTAVVGAFDPPTVSLLEKAGFNEIRFFPYDGYDSSRALAESREMGWGVGVRLVYFRDLPRHRFPPLRCFFSSFSWGGRSLVFWRSRAVNVFIKGQVTQLVNSFRGPFSPPLVVVSLGGGGEGKVPVRWTNGRRSWAYAFSSGWGLRESEIRSVLMVWPSVWNDARPWSAVGKLSDVGPLLFSLLEPPRKNFLSKGKGPPLLKKREVSEAILIRGEHATALVMDGHLKYIRHSINRTIPVRRFLFFRWFVQTDFEPEELFDLWTDPLEMNNLVRRRRTLLARCRQRMDLEVR